MYLDASVDVNALAKQIGEAISTVNKAAQPLLLHGWQVYVRQEFISGEVGVTLNAVFMVVFGVFTGIVLPKLYSWAKNYEYRSRDDEGLAYMIPVIYSIVGACLIVLMIVNIVNGVMYMANPEYYALQEILHQTGH